MPQATMQAKFQDSSEKQWKLVVSFSHRHLLSESSWSQLSGRKHFFVFGVVDNVNDAEITMIPLIIATPYNNVGMFSSEQELWRFGREIYVDYLDSFSEVQNVKRSRSEKDLEILRKIPERSIKLAFAEIIGEARVPKDWGGERSDLFSSCVVMNGNRVSTAFIFKGPSQFKPMTMAELGKNGDQIERLYTEPADLMVLQHCHEITLPVRSNMRTYAQRAGNLKICCIIDGYDTLRILKAYRKCGFRDELQSIGQGQDEKLV
ncbi:MAG: hypothetical protein HQM01_07750 [Magnetococcales bacterium]|nr:hypothetical protein [Magnetococcales bacterium]